MALTMKALKEVTGKGAVARPQEPTAATVRVLGTQKVKIASQPSCSQRGYRRIEAAQVLGWWGRGES